MMADSSVNDKPLRLMVENLESILLGVKAKQVELLAVMPPVFVIAAITTAWRYNSGTNRREATVPTTSPSLTPNEVEAANRAEVTALLIRAGYRVYRPEADCYGEDLILRDREEKLHAVQLKSRPTVDWKKLGGNGRIWMLFPDPESGNERRWFLVPHDELYEWTKQRHGHTPKWDDTWSYPHISRELADFLEPFRLS